MSLDCCTFMNVSMKGSKALASLRWMATMLRPAPGSKGDSMPSMTASGVPAAVRSPDSVCSSDRSFHQA